MTRLADANLIALYSFYLASMALLSFARRSAIYWEILQLLVAVRGRWPRVVQRLTAHHGLLVTREVLAPTLVAVALTALQMVLARAVYPQARLAVGEVAENTWLTLVLLAAALPMVGVDAYFLYAVGAFDRPGAEQYLDLAERWLGTWRAGAVRVATLGYFDPRRMVDEEVRKGMDWFGQMTSRTMRWVAIQVLCRMLFGLAVWASWWAVRGS